MLTSQVTELRFFPKAKVKGEQRVKSSREIAELSLVLY